MEVSKFGERLRELREEAGLSQGQLADKVGVNFTYLSKIESGAKPPPSKKVIRSLAEVLNVDSDELMVWAGKVPSDIIEMLNSRENLQSLRSGHFSKVRSVNKKESFNRKLGELRQQAHLSQKDLADKVGISTAYISKIESGVLAPPSQSVILKLAEALNADKDVLMTLAGKIPTDIAQILNNQETLKRLRSHRKEAKTGGRPMKLFTNYKMLPKIATAFVLVLAVMGSLWLAAPLPTKALSITVPDTIGTIASTATITGTVNVQSGDILPILNVDLEIFGGGNSETFTGLPLETVSGVSYTGTNGSTATISAVTGSGWGYGYGNRRAYGYGYGIGWGTGPPAGYHIFGVNTFGYGYAPPAQGVTFIAYIAHWNVPSSWTVGNYTIRFRVHANSVDFVEDGTLTLSAAPVVPPAAGGGGGPPLIPSVPGVTDVSANVDPSGVFTTDVTAQSADGNATVTIDIGTQGLTAEGTPLQEITIQPITTPPPAPEGATVIDDAGALVATVEDITFIGLPFEIGPTGATFSEKIAITFNIDPDALPAGVDPSNLRLGFWDAAAGTWVILETTFDPVTNTLTGLTDHLTLFSIISVPPVELEPAAFDVSGLVITPTTADIVEVVTINVLVANTGDLTGSYEVTLKINNVAVDTKDVTLDGGASEIVIFTITQDVAGTYTVDVNGLSGTFTVEVPPVPPAPAAFEVSQLSILPAEVQVGETVTVSATVANTGEVEGSYTVTLKINGATEATKEVTIAGGQTTKVTFSVDRDVAASYQVDIDGQTGSFTVTEAEAPLAWWIWLIVGLVVVAAIVGVVIWRRRAY